MNCTDRLRTPGGIWARLAIFVALAGLVTASALAQVPIAGAAGGSLQNLVDSPTMVTVVLKPGENAATTGEISDPNLHVIGVEPDYLVTKNAEGIRNVYLFADIQEVRVQGGQIEAPQRQVKITRALNATEKSVLDSAISRTTEAFQGNNENQDLKMTAAGLLAANQAVAGEALSTAAAASGDAAKSVEAAQAYLVEVASANDAANALSAGLHLYLAGNSAAATKAVSLGIESSSRKSRIDAAELAGLIGDRTVEGQLLSMVRDRSADVSAPAGLALARLGNREVIPILLDMISDINSAKGEASVLGLATLGGDDVVEQMKVMLKESNQTVARFRMAMVLFRLHDPLGEQLLAREFLQVPSLARDSALALAARGNARGIEFLRSRVDERMDEVPENYMFRARAAGALIEGGDRWAISKLQEALRTGNPDVEAYTCDVISEVGNRSLLSVVHPAIESPDPNVTLAAARAAFAIINPDFRERWLRASPNLLSEPDQGTLSGGTGR